MKNVNWDKCKNPGVFTKDPAFKDPESIAIKSKMKISAKYKGHRITLKIIDKTADNTYSALVTDVAPLNKKKLDDLSTGDEVSIERKFICSITE